MQSGRSRNDATRTSFRLRHRRLPIRRHQHRHPRQPTPRHQHRHPRQPTPRHQHRSLYAITYGDMKPGTRGGPLRWLWMVSSMSAQPMVTCTWWTPDPVPQICDGGIEQEETCFLLRRLQTARSTSAHWTDCTLCTPTPAVGNGYMERDRCGPLRWLWTASSTSAHWTDCTRWTLATAIGGGII